nr:uncharacterized protein LOC111844775 isoform X3 [Paramormyrops kingsleyae]
MVTLLLLLCLVDHLPAVFEADFSVSPGETVTLPCDGGTDKDISEGSWMQRAAETPPKESDSLVCKPYEDKDKEVPDENSPGAPSSVWLIVILSVIVGIVGIAVIVVILVIVVIVGIVSFIKRRRNQPGTQMQTDHTPTPEAVPLNEIVPNSPQIHLDNLAPPPTPPPAVKQR